MLKATLLTLAAAALLVTPAWAKSTGLTGEVGPGFSIEVKKGTKDLKTIPAGSYKLKVEDKSGIHNFHLIGPGVNKSTSIATRTETIWTVKLRPGKYTYLCDPHSSGMRGTFRVTA